MTVTILSRINRNQDFTEVVVSDGDWTGLLLISAVEVEDAGSLKAAIEARLKEPIPVMYSQVAWSVKDLHRD